MNVAAVLIDLIQLSDYFRIIARSPTIKRLSEIAFSNEEEFALSRNASKTVLEKLIQVINDNKSLGFSKNIQDDDDLTK